MIRYFSTRGDRQRFSFSEAVLKGIASDGGLFIPEKLPHLTRSQLLQLVRLSYQQRAVYVLSRFETDFSNDSLHHFVDNAYGNNFDTSAIAPVSCLQENQYLLELWHGPTGAFKDMALQLMPQFFQSAIQKEKTKKRYLILVATSGDTGKAALEGYKDKENISIMVMYPKNGVSLLQEKQMVTQEGANVEVLALEGNFDAVQKCVKEIFANSSFAKQLEAHNIILSSANSINWGRLLPQIVYYVSAYVELVRKNSIRWGEVIDVAVPSGNFGNILAAFYAKQMGIPLRKLICASNENNVLTEFLRTGVYDVAHRTLIKTPSPSMDILIASNIERLLYTLTHDSQKVASWMADLRTLRKFVVDEPTQKQLQEHFYAGWVSNEDCLKNIKDVYEKTGVILDPHTSVAQKVVEDYSKETVSSVPVLIAATAHFSKFAKDVYTALFGVHNKSDEFVLLQRIAQKTQQQIPRHISALASKPVRFNSVCPANEKSLEGVLLQKFT